MEICDHCLVMPPLFNQHRIVFIAERHITVCHLTVKELCKSKIKEALAAREAFSMATEKVLFV